MLVRRIRAPVAAAGQTWARAFGAAIAPRASAFSGHVAGGAHGPSRHGYLPGTSYALLVQSARKASVPRDPERPKKPLTAYIRFSTVYRKKHDGKKSIKEVAAAWKTLSETEKRPFEQEAASDQVVYKKKLDEYKASGKLEAWSRDPAKPKKPLTAFMSWAQEKRKALDIQKLPVAEAAKKLGADWKTVPQVKKEPLEAKFKADMVKYNAEMKAYKDSGKEESWLERTGRLAIRRKAEAKERALKEKLKQAKEKEQQKKEQAKAKAAKDKEKAKLKKDKDMAKAKAAKAKAAKDAEKKKATLLKAKEKAALAKKKKKAAADKAKAKAASDKEKSKAAKEKAAQKAKAEKEKKAKEGKAATDAVQGMKAQAAAKAQNAPAS